MPRSKGHIQLIVRAIVVKGKNLLVCRIKEANYYFLPGGHVEFGEHVETALRRELREELGLRVRSAKHIGVVHNTFMDGKTMVHEMNFVFAVRPDRHRDRGLEGHLEFSWIPLAQLSTVRVYPTRIKRALVGWLKNKKPFAVL
jgi:8-oxo-dGTP diphosphatase